MALYAVPTPQAPKPRVAEFFAGIGLARMGLEDAGFEVAWSNDIEEAKYAMYRAHFQDSDTHEFALEDIAKIGADAIPPVDLAWASFPCTDLSLAGARAGLAGSSSSTFYEFVRVLEEMADSAPSVVALENVHGLATSHGGEDMAAAVRALNQLGYSVDVLSIDARRFVPQSRPRLFLVGAKHPPRDWPEDSPLRPDFLQSVFSDPGLRTHRARLPDLPAPLAGGLGDYAENLDADDPRWWDAERFGRFVASLSPVQRARFDALRDGSEVQFRTAYRRTRAGVAVWEIRPDDISGCLRTARGGSSKQAVVQVGRGKAQVRWMTPVEYARLMGAGDYVLDSHPASRVLFGFGDAVCAPVVAWVGREYLFPLLTEHLAMRTYDMPLAANG